MTRPSTGGEVMMIRKLLIAALLFPLVWFGSAAMHFPRVFQVMLMIYILLGLGVFLLLDAPSVPRVEGWKAVAALVAFYLVISVAYILGASYLPQYDPAVEMSKIEKIVKPKLETRSEEHTSELQSLAYLVCRLLLEKKKTHIMLADICTAVIMEYYCQA